MVKESQLIFQIDSPAVIEAFKADNYSIEYTAETAHVEKDLCVLYFSSNEIYYPNTLDSFNYSIIQRDKYEWKRNKFPRANKHIFLRDIHKQWYLSGINTTLDNPQKLLDFLRKETVGYRIITMGSSAGGYGALLFGSLLKCERIYAFNAQLNLKVTMQNSNALTDPILFEKANDVNWTAYYDLSNFISPTIDNFYFQSCHSKMDIEQYEAISIEAKKNLKIIRLQTSNHGFPFLRINLPYVLAFTPKELAQYVNKTFHPILFSIRLIGVIPTIIFILKALKDRYQKKRLEASLKTKLTNPKN
jgi:hypothetical protein